MRLERHFAGLRLRASCALRRCGVMRDESGSALVELAVTLSLLGVPLLLGMVYTATLLLDSIEISNAAHAGAMYGMRSSTLAEDTSQIQAAAQAEASDFGTNLTVTPTMYYACSNAIGGTQYTTTTAANAACNGGSSHTLQFLKVVASAPVKPLGKVPGMAATVTLIQTSVMEVQE